MIECACGQTYDADDDEEFYSECSICGDVTCDDCCAILEGEPRTCQGCW